MGFNSGFKGLNSAVDGDGQTYAPITLLLEKKFQVPNG